MKLKYPGKIIARRTVKKEFIATDTNSTLPDFVCYGTIDHVDWEPVNAIMKRAKRWIKKGFYLNVVEVPLSDFSLFAVHLMGPNQAKFGPLSKIPKEVFDSIKG